MTSLTASMLSGKEVTGPVSARITIDGREYINFFGSGYLALSRVPEIRHAVERELERRGPFARQVSASLGATDRIFDAVERAAAAACGTEASVYVPSGYLIGAVGLAGLHQAFDVLLLDEHAHPNLQDAAKVAGLPIFMFAHCDAESVAEILRTHLRARQRPLLVTDGVFATSGCIPPMADYAAVLESFDGRLFIDESHAFGVVGAQGRGAAEYCGVSHLASTGATLSKAFCAQGAVVGCSQEMALRLQRQQPIRGACAGSPLSAVAATQALHYVATRANLRVELRALTTYFRQRLRDIGLDVIDSPAPIVSFDLATRAQMLALRDRLFARGIHLYHSTYVGAGPEGTIRCSVFRDHSRADIDALIGELAA